MKKRKNARNRFRLTRGKKQIAFYHPLGVTLVSDDNKIYYVCNYNNSSWRCVLKPADIRNKFVDLHIIERNDQIHLEVVSKGKWSICSPEFPLWGYFHIQFIGNYDFAYRYVSENHIPNEWCFMCYDSKNGKFVNKTSRYKECVKNVQHVQCHRGFVILGGKNSEFAAVNAYGKSSKNCEREAALKSFLKNSKIVYTNYRLNDGSEIPKINSWKKIGDIFSGEWQKVILNKAM